MADFTLTTNMKDLTGKRFGCLFVVKPVGINKWNTIQWLCECVCGNTKILSRNHLQDGGTRSCGCFRRRRMKEVHKIHGQAGANKTSEYTAWQNANHRCYDPKNEHYHNYGGRGITVCERWKTNFENFFADMGKKPSPSHSLDRINNNGNYEPSNCRWATYSEQSKNRRKRVVIQNYSNDEILEEIKRRGLSV